MTKKITPAITDQKGMASVVVVTVLVVILTLITLGFTRLMDRAIKNSLNNQLGSAAYYAARSGINDAIAYLTAFPNTSATVCNDPVLLSVYNAGKLSGLDENTKYTCILINQNPSDLTYQKLPPFKSRVVRLTPATGLLNKLLLSWQSTDRVNDQVPVGGNTLYTQTDWGGSKYEPILRVTLYPIQSDSQLLSTVAADTKTIFLYPSDGGGQVQSFSGITNGELRAAECDSTTSPSFPGSADYHCNIIIDGLDATGAQYHYIRLTPLYQQADVKIKGDIGGQAAKFTGAQAVVDVTAKANTSVRRLAARVDTSSAGGNQFSISPGDNAIPENSIRSAAAICKRLTVLPTQSDSISAAYCGLLFQ